MKLYKLHSSNRGRFIIPHKSGRRMGFHHHQHHQSTNGTGLLLSKDLGGFGLDHPVSTHSMSALQSKLNKLTIGGNIHGPKKKYISFRI